MDSRELIIDSKSEEIIRKVKKDPLFDWKSELKQYILGRRFNNYYEVLISERVSYQILHNIEKG